MKRNEHPACSCTACRRGAGSDAGQATHRRINRAIRRRYKRALQEAARSSEPDADPVIISTPYTD